MRIGILGGTFNPVHSGHLHLANHVLKKLRLSRVIFIPTHIPPHKRISGNATPADRLRMLRLALGRSNRFSLCGYEIKKGGTSYSVKTAEYLRKRFGRRAELFFIIGADSLAGLRKWKNIKQLRKIVQFAAVPRPRYRAGSLASSVLKIKIPGNDISSSEIRRRARRKKNIKGMVPAEVLHYIERKKLYR